MVKYRPVLESRFKSMSLSYTRVLPTALYFHSRHVRVLSLWLLRRLWASLCFGFLISKSDISTPLLSVHCPSFTSRRDCDNGWAPFVRCLDIFEERQQGNVKCGDGDLFKGGWWMETSWHFKWQHLKGSGIFQKPRQEISVTNYWFGVYVSHLIQWLIWREAACMLGFHLVRLKA